MKQKQQRKRNINKGILTYKLMPAIVASVVLILANVLIIYIRFNAHVTAIENDFLYEIESKLTKRVEEIIKDSYRFIYTVQVDDTPTLKGWAKIIKGFEQADFLDSAHHIRLGFITNIKYKGKDTLLMDRILFEDTLILPDGEESAILEQLLNDTIFTNHPLKDSATIILGPYNMMDTLRLYLVHPVTRSVKFNHTFRGELFNDKDRIKQNGYFIAGYEIRNIDEVLDSIKDKYTNVSFIIKTNVRDTLYSSERSKTTYNTKLASDTASVAGTTFIIEIWGGDIFSRIIDAIAEQNKIFFIAIFLASIGLYVLLNSYLQKLTAVENRYRIVSQNSSYSLVVLDAKTFRIIDLDNSIFIVTGYQPSELLGKSLLRYFTSVSHDFIQMLTVEQLDAEIADYLSGNTDVSSHFITEGKFMHKTGEAVWVSIGATFMPDRHGKIATIYMLLHRIDKRKNSELEVARQRDELEVQTNELKQQHKELEEANNTKDRFFSIIAHDLRNPLAAVSNIVEVFSNYFTVMSKEQASHSLQTLTASVSQVIRLLENLLEWSRSNLGGIKFSPTEVYIADLIEDCVSDLEVQAKIKNIKLILNYDILKGIRVFCDIDMIATVSRNLLSNAIKFSKDNSSIWIEIADYIEDDSQLIVTIRDEGVGIPAVSLSKLFKIEEKISTKGTKGENGTGLGLILCAELIAKHNCKIWAESEQHVGSAFKFTLPKISSTRATVVAGQESH
ncbi:MAG: PAS domain-containing sensor histidine kinase [Ignavibacteria bacterium]|jgi:signal transduction histidine kinase|nr:PAS domain-containing sensor histidine kinase [Ignavibacteria bacterium]